MEDEGKEYNWYTGKWEGVLELTSPTTDSTSPCCGGDPSMDWKYCPYCGELWKSVNGEGRV